MISRSGKPRGLICIQHSNSNGGPVLEGASTQEARIYYGVEDLHREGVGAPALVVHRLGRRRRKRGEFVGLKIFNAKVFYYKFRHHCEMSNGDAFTWQEIMQKCHFLNIRPKGLLFAFIWSNYHTKFSTDDC